MKTIPESFFSLFSLFSLFSRTVSRNLFDQTVQLVTSRPNNNYTLRNLPMIYLFIHLFSNLLSTICVIDSLCHIRPSACVRARVSCACTLCSFYNMCIRVYI